METPKQCKLTIAYEYTVVPLPLEKSAVEELEAVHKGPKYCSPDYQYEVLVVYYKDGERPPQSDRRRTFSMAVPSCTQNHGLVQAFRRCLVVQVVFEARFAPSRFVRVAWYQGERARCSP